MNTVTVSSKSQVVIPLTVRNALGLRPGEKVRVMRYDGRVELTPGPVDPEDAGISQRDGYGYRAGGGSFVSGRNVVDSSAWIEYLANTKLSAHFAGALENTDKLVVPVILWTQDDHFRGLPNVRYFLKP